MNFSTYIGKFKIRFNSVGTKSSRYRVFKLGLSGFSNEKFYWTFHFGYYDFSIWYRG